MITLIILSLRERERVILQGEDWKRMHIIDVEH